MTRSYFRLFIFLSGVFFLINCVGVYADQETTSTTTTTTETPEGNTVVKEVKKTTRIVTPVPAPKETVNPPQGYVTCYKVAEGWFNNVWVPTHQVCQYQNSDQGSVWIEGYWGCNSATADGVCTNWDWRAGHWEKNQQIVY